MDGMAWAACMQDITIMCDPSWTVHSYTHVIIIPLKQFYSCLTDNVNVVKVNPQKSAVLKES